MALILGEAGVGKTRLAREATHRVAERGMLVLRGECIQLSEGEFPYAPIASCLRDIEPGALTQALAELPAPAASRLGPARRSR